MDAPTPASLLPDGCPKYLRLAKSFERQMKAGVLRVGDRLPSIRQLRERDLDVFRASVEDFHRSREAQSDFGPDTPARYYGYGIDESALKRSLVEPFRMAGSTAFVTRAFDLVRDAWVEPKWRTGPADAILVLDGRFLLRDRLRDLWDFAIAVDGDPLDAADRVAYASSDPRDVAAIVVDLADPEHTRRSSAD